MTYKLTNLALLAVTLLTVAMLHAHNHRLELINEPGLTNHNPNTQLVREWQTELNKTKTHRQSTFASTNNIINKIHYEEDIDHWKHNDYWATPFEFFGTRAGDCEDYALAKYFTLLAKGIDQSTLKLMHVQALDYGVAHMVLIHTPNPGGPSYVYDNLMAQIKTTTERTDLEPVYAFNITGLYIGNRKGMNTKVKNSAGSIVWDNLLKKMADDGSIKLLNQ